MSGSLASFRSAVAESDYRATGWTSTKTPIVTPRILSPVADVNEDRRRRFDALANQWSAETSLMSSIADMVAHPAYRSIVAMGAPATSLLLERLERAPDFWFEALRQITGQNPVPDQDVGDLSRMTQAWLSWGDTNGYR